MTWGAVGTGVMEGVQWEEDVPGTWNERATWGAQVILADYLEDRTGETG